MNAVGLLQHFERISEAPDAVPRLRRFILDLAVRGKLVEQDPGDEPASELLKQIQAEKARLVEDGEIRKQQAFQSIEANEVPFQVPDSWALVRLGQALELFNGRAFKPSEWDKSGLPIIRIQNLNNADAPFNFCATPVPEKFHVKTGDFLISWSGTPGTSFGAHIWDRGHAILNQHIFRAKLIGDVFLPPFLKLAINSRLLELIDQAHGGAGLQHITKPKLERLPLTLPPLAEQHRIIAKVDELMALCDRLEVAQVDRETRRDRLVAASLHRLNNGADADAFREHARFHLRHVPRVTTRPEHIQQLRQTIFNLAVRGQLVPRDPDDECASKLLERIHAERVELIRALALKRDNGESQWSADNIPFDLPPTWKWAPLQSLIVFGPQNGISPKPSARPDAPRAITLTATTKGTFDPNYFKQVEAAIPHDSEFWLRPGDLLFQRGNTREYVGIAAYYTGKAGLFLYPDLMMKVRLSEKVSLRYVHLCAVAPYARAYFSAHASGAQATMPKINQGTLVQLSIPLPPLAEQIRIVAKVKDLMAVCDLLEVQIGNTATNSRQLLEATLHAMLLKVQRQAPEVKRGNRPAPTEVGNELPRSSI